MDTTCPPSVRALFAWEIQEARRVFASQLNYERVRIHECTQWPNTMNRIGSTLKRIPYVDSPNAITLGNHLYFPVKLLSSLVPASHPEHYMICWLIHELTHAWQFQHLGWSYLATALSAQFRLGAQAYEFGGEAGLQKALEAGVKFADFNLEQQGDIARSYYYRLCLGADVSAWTAYINEIQHGV
jgi:hypothetical protein